MRLFIAEKPSLARAIADGLGNGKKFQGYITCKQDIVTWCFGHMLELFNPEDYDLKYKSWAKDTLPIIPKMWNLKPRPSAAAQLNIIANLLEKADSVVNAGDPDREGQLLIDEVLEHLHYNGSVTRIWLASLDIRSVGKALANLTDNKQYAPLRDAARARSQADWLIGLNATRAMTILGRNSGHDSVLSLGRVQTPTLNLVVTRDREIASFKPQDFFTIQAVFNHIAGQIQCTFIPEDNQVGLDAHGRLTDIKVATSITDSLQNTDGNIVKVTKEKKQKSAPLPHCLSSLQKSASAKFGMSAQQVLDTAQSLYEKKLTTYPRSDCRYLPVEQYEDVGRIMLALNKIPSLEQAASKANIKLKSAAWNTSKITAHHAIIPTGEMPSNLSEAEQNIFNMIATAFCLQFYAPLVYEAQKIQISANNFNFEAKGRLILEPGFILCAKEDEDDDAKEEKKAEQSLPIVTEGDSVNVAEALLNRKKTTPPLKFTEGSLIEAMANIHRFVDDPKAKATLKENEGIGTEATRAGILEALKKRGYLQANGKAIVSTPLAGKVIDLTPQALKDPITTAQWESKLESIAQGKSNLSDFMAEQINILPNLLAPLLSGEIKENLADGKMYPCPKCGKALKQRKGSNGMFWSCPGYPECKTTLSDDKGKPKENTPTKISEYTCPACNSPLTHRQGKRKDGKGTYDLYACTGYPKCKNSYFTKNGKPDFTATTK